MIMTTSKTTEIKRLRLNLGEVELEYSGSIKYLGIHLDNKLNFKIHINRTAEKASEVAMALSRLMPNIRGPIEARRRLYVTVVYSIML